MLVLGRSFQSFVVIAFMGCLAAAAATWLGTPAVRLSNLEFPAGDFPHTYLMLSAEEVGACRLVKRTRSVTRRYNASMPGPKRRYRRIPPASPAASLPSWLVQTKQHGSICFVPLEEVVDWGFPFLYQRVRERVGDVNLPHVGWTHLFVDRIYAGLYLQVNLPNDGRKKDGRKEGLRQLLFVDGAGLTHLDTRFQTFGRTYQDAVVEGRFPSLGELPAALVELARRSPTEESVFLLRRKLAPTGTEAVLELSLLPLPISLRDLYRRLQGRSLRPIVDQRHRSWRAQLDAATPAHGGEFGRDLQVHLDEYIRRFRGACVVHGRFHANQRHLESHLPARMTGLTDLGLRIDNR